MKKSSSLHLPKFYSTCIVLLLASVMLNACQNIPEPSGNVKNPESQLLNTLIRPNDISGNWRWETFSLNQPSQVQWIDTNELTDSATVDIAGILMEDSKKKFYISIYQTVVQYDIPISTTKRVEINSVFDEIKTSFVPKLSTSVNPRAMCFQTSQFIDCEVILEYERIFFITSLITPLDFGKQATGDFLEIIMQVTDDRIKSLQTQ